MGARSLLRNVFVGDEARSDPIGTLEQPSSDLIAALEAAETYDSAGFRGAGGRSVTGKAITPATALNMLAVYACVRVIAEDVGGLPLHTFEKLRDATGRRVRERVHEEDDERALMLGEEPNPELTAQKLYELVTGHENLWGNGYLYKILGGDGRARELWPLPPDRTAPVRLPDGSKGYATRLENGETRVLFPDEVIHLSAFGTGELGIPPIGVARQAIGIAIAAEEYAGRFWANDARPGGVIQTKETIAPKDYDRALRRWKAHHQGLDRSHLVAFLDNGAEWKDVGIPPEDAQFIETRKFQVREIARMFRVPPYKIADLEAGAVAYASVEVQSIDYLQTALNPWLKRLEAGLKRGVYGSSLDRERGLYVEFVRAAILQGDFKSTIEALGTAVEKKLMTQNEARERINLKPLEGGDEIKPPAPPPQLPPPPPPPPAPADDVPDPTPGGEG